MKLSSRYLPITFTLATAIAIVLTGCATVKPSYLDTSGGKIKSVVVYASFENAIGTKLTNQILSEAFAKSVCKEMVEQGGARCETTSSNLPVPPELSTVGASHLIILRAKLYRHMVPSTSYYNTCLYTDKSGKCQVGMSGSPAIPPQMSLTAEVFEKQSGKAIFIIDKPRSLNSDDGDERKATAFPAKMFVNGLKESGLL